MATHAQVTPSRFGQRDSDGMATHDALRATTDSTAQSHVRESLSPARRMVLLNLGVRDVVSKVMFATIAVGAIVIIGQSLADSFHVGEESEQTTQNEADDLSYALEYFAAQASGPLVRSEGPHDDALRQHSREASRKHRMTVTGENDTCDSLEREGPASPRRVRLRHRAAPSRRRRLGPLRRSNRAHESVRRPRSRHRAPSYSTTDTETSDGISNENRGFVARTVAIREHFETRNATKTLKRALLFDHVKDLGVTPETDVEKEASHKRGQQHTAERFITVVNQEQASLVSKTAAVMNARAHKTKQICSPSESYCQAIKSWPASRTRSDVCEGSHSVSNQDDIDSLGTDLCRPLLRACDGPADLVARAQHRNGMALAWTRWCAYTRQRNFYEQSAVKCQRFACQNQQSRIQETVPPRSPIDQPTTPGSINSSTMLTDVTLQRCQRIRAGATIAQFVQEKLSEWRRRCLHRQIEKRRVWRQRQKEREQLLRRRLYAALCSRGGQIDALLLAAELTKWVSSVMVQLHIDTTQLPSCASGSSCGHDRVDWFKFEGRNVPQPRRRRLRGRLLERARQQSRLAAASMLQVVLRCRFALRLLGAKRKYLDGIVSCPELLGLGLHTRAAVLIQAAWRFSQSRQRWGRFVLLGKLRLLLLSCAAQHRR